MDHGLFQDSGRTSHRHQAMHVPLFNTSCQQTPLHAAHVIRGSSCKALRSVLETTSTSSRCLCQENHLNGNPGSHTLHLDLSCCHLGFILQLLLVQIVASMNSNSRTALGLNLGLVGLASLVRMVVLYSMNRYTPPAVSKPWQGSQVQQQHVLHL